MTTYRIDGADVHGISDLYDQFNREFMAEQDWRLGATLDGLNDILYRIDSEIEAGEPAVLVWADHTHSRDVLGVDATRRWLEDKLSRPGSFNQKGIQADLDDLENGVAKTYFERVLEVFADHPLLELQLR